MKNKKNLLQLLIVLLLITLFSGLVFALHIDINRDVKIIMKEVPQTEADKEKIKAFYHTDEVMAHGAGIRYKLTGYTIHREPQYEGNPEALGSANIGYIDGIEVEKIPIKL